MTTQLTADQSLARLIEGNRRFVDGTSARTEVSSPTQRHELAERGQTPFAVILSCSDSRAPSEYIFNARLGDLFIVRVAGNIIAPSLIGSIEFAASQLGTNLVVVMGHTGCGAIKSAISSVCRGEDPITEGISTIVHEVTPAVLEHLHSSHAPESDEFLSKVVRSNVQNSLSHLMERSELLTNLQVSRGLKAVGATYDIRTGAVDFSP